MKVTRILVLKDGPGRAGDLRLTVFGRPVECDFDSPEGIIQGHADLTRYRAIVAPLESAGKDLLGALQSSRNGSLILFFQGDPPLREVARWVAWTDRQGGESDADDPTGRLLSESLEYYTLASLYQQCLKILSTDDEEKRLDRITDTFMSELGAESCVIWLSSRGDPDEMMIASVRGVIGIDREGSRFFLSQTEMSGTIWKGAPFHDPAGGGRFLYVPLLSGEKPIGLVKLGERTSRKPYCDRDLYLARVIGEYAAASQRTADRLTRMGRISLRDADTGAYSPSFLEDYFEMEKYRAARFRRPLSVIFLIIGNFPFLIEKTRESLVVGALSEATEGIRKALRDSDLIARVEPNRFCVVLPETDHFGSLLALRRLRKAVRDKCAIRYLGGEHALQPFFTSVTFPRDGRDLAGLWRVAESKYARQQKSPYYRLRLQEKTFWDAFDTLLGKPEYYDLLRRGEEVPYFTRVRRDFGRNSHFWISRDTFLRMVESIAQDVVATPSERELVIAAGPRPEIFKQIFLSFGKDPAEGRSIYVIGQSGASRFDAKNLLYINAEDENLKNREIILCLKESGAYGIFAAGKQDAVGGFNTADEWLVEGMMEKIQDLYSLQGGF